MGLRGKFFYFSGLLHSKVRLLEYIPENASRSIFYSRYYKKEEKETPCHVASLGEHRFLSTIFIEHTVPSGPGMFPGPGDVAVTRANGLCPHGSSVLGGKDRHTGPINELLVQELWPSYRSSGSVLLERQREENQERRICFFYCCHPISSSSLCCKQPKD